MNYRVVVAAAFTVVVAVPAGGEERADARAGQEFARVHCSGCHDVEGLPSTSPNPAAPTFASVAQTSGMNGRALAAWLDTSHPTMPNFVLDAQDRDNVIAYIMSLQPR